MSALLDLFSAEPLHLLSALGSGSVDQKRICRRAPRNSWTVRRNACSGEKYPYPLGPLHEHPTSMKHLCTCCYLKGNKDYMLDAYHFAISKATDFYEMYASPGRWTRCMHCMECCLQGYGLLRHVCVSRKMDKVCALYGRS